MSWGELSSESAVCSPGLLAPWVLSSNSCLLSILRLLKTFSCFLKVFCLASCPALFGRCLKEKTGFVSGLVLYLSLLSRILVPQVSNFVLLASGDKQKLCWFLCYPEAAFPLERKAWVDSQLLDLCPELAMPPGKEGQLNICSPLSSFLFSGLLVAGILVALLALSDTFKQLV